MKDIIIQWLADHTGEILTGVASFIIAMLKKKRDLQHLRKAGVLKDTAYYNQNGISRKEQH